MLCTRHGFHARRSKVFRLLQLHYLSEIVLPTTAHGLRCAGRKRYYKCMSSFPAQPAICYLDHSAFPQKLSLGLQSSLVSPENLLGEHTSLPESASHEQGREVRRIACA